MYPTVISVPYASKLHGRARIQSPSSSHATMIGRGIPSTYLLSRLGHGPIEGLDEPSIRVAGKEVRLVPTELCPRADEALWSLCRALRPGERCQEREGERPRTCLQKRPAAGGAGVTGGGSWSGHRIGYCEADSAFEILCAACQRLRRLWCVE